MPQKKVESLGHECKYIEWIGNTNAKMDNLIEGVGVIKDNCTSHHEEAHKQSERIIKLEGEISQALKETQLLFDKDKARGLREEKEARALKLKEAEDARVAQLSNGARGKFKKHAPMLYTTGGAVTMWEVAKLLIQYLG